MTFARDLFIVGSISGLLILGLVIVIFSGPPQQGERLLPRGILRNIGNATIVFMGALAGLFMLQQIVGFPIGTHW